MNHRRMLFASAIVASSLLFLSGCMTKGQLTKKADDIVFCYNNDYDNYDNTINDLTNLIEKTNNSENHSYIVRMLDLVDDLKMSKENFKLAEKEFSGKRYKDAVRYYEEVIEEDLNYDKAVAKIEEAKKKYLEVIREKADVFVQDGKFEEAIVIYKDAQGFYDDGTIDKAISTIEDQYRKKQEEGAAKYEKEKDWASAISVYNSLSDYFNDNSYEVAITKAKNACVNEAIKKAEKYLSEYDYANAKAVIKQADKVVPHNVELKDELDRIDDFVPIPLTSLSVFCQDTESNYLVIDEWTRADTDNMGESGEQGIKIRNSGAMNQSVNVTYMLDGKYNTLTGRFAIHGDFKNCTDEKKYGAQLLVYLDGELVYGTEAVLGGVKPIEVEVDVTGASEMKLTFYSGAPFSFMLDDMLVFGFIDPILSKNYTPKN